VLYLSYPYEVGGTVCVESVGPRGLLNREVGYPHFPKSFEFWL
jgi:hypothetical protein